MNGQAARLAGFVYLIVIMPGMAMTCHSARFGALMALNILVPSGARTVQDISPMRISALLGNPANRVLSALVVNGVGSDCMVNLSIS